MYMYKTTVLSKLGNNVFKQIIEILIRYDLAPFFRNFVLFYFGEN